MFKLFISVISSTSDSSLPHGRIVVNMNIRELSTLNKKHFHSQQHNRNADNQYRNHDYFHFAAYFVVQIYER